MSMRTKVFKGLLISRLNIKQFSDSKSSLKAQISIPRLECLCANNTLYVERTILNSLTSCQESR